MNQAWTSPRDIEARVRRRWDDGSLLRSYARREPFPVTEVPLRGPSVAQIASELGAVQRWVAALEAGRRGDARYTLRSTPVGGRLIGRNDLPSRAVVSTYSQAWALLRVETLVGEFDDAMLGCADEPEVLTWVVSHPLVALAQRDKWPSLVAAYRWLESQRFSGRYVREIDAPGVDTKFVERNRGVLSGLLHVPATSVGFTRGLGMATKPEMVRLRLDPALDWLPGLSDITARLDELARLGLPVVTTVIIENEVTFLSVPVPRQGAVMWGRGFDMGRASSLPWLIRSDVRYWGDLDTHGFAILNQLRAAAPTARSFLMDRETLLRHQLRWGVDEKPTRARLERLTAEESDVYADLVADRLGDRVRLEQERIDWSWCTSRFGYDPAEAGPATTPRAPSLS